MVARPLRAMLRARLELIWNAISKGSGPLSVVSGAVVIVLGAACLIPPCYMFSVFGRQLPLGEDVPGSSPSLVWLATLQALLVFGMGGVAGLRAHRGFDRELLRALPLRTSQLLLAELPFGLLDTIPVLALACFAGLGLGLTRSHPHSQGVVALVVGLGVLDVLLVQQLVGVVRRLLVQPRSILIALGLAAGPGLAIVGFNAGQGLRPAFFLALEWLPTSLGDHGLRAWVHGDLAAAAGFLILAGAFTAALFALTAWLQVKELRIDPPLRQARGGPGNLWSFRRPSVGVAHLFVSQVLGARYGKVLLVLPVFFSGLFVLCAVKVQYVAAGSVMERLFDAARGYPLFALVPPSVVLLGGGLWMNQFAWDRSGVKTLFLTPLRAREILDGKLLGLILILVPQSLAACLPLVLLHGPSAPELGCGLLSALWLACALGTMGHVLSARFPRRLAESGAGVASVPFPLQLVSAAVVAAVSLIGLGLYAGLQGFQAWAPAGGFALLTALALGLRRAALPRLTMKM